MKKLMLLMLIAIGICLCGCSINDETNMPVDKTIETFSEINIGEETYIKCLDEVKIIGTDDTFKISSEVSSKDMPSR